MQTRTILSLTGATALAALVGYALYFDHRRQTDASFRKALKRERRRAARQNDAAAGAREKDTARAVEQAVRDVLAPGALPAGTEAREAFFMQCVSEGETLFAQGPEHTFAAAVAFFKALKVYPAPMELVMIYQKAVPPHVFALIMEMIGAEAKIGGANSSDPLAALARAAAGAPTAGSAQSNIDEIDDDDATPAPLASGATAAASPVSAPTSSSASGNGSSAADADGYAYASSQEDGHGSATGSGNGIASGYSSQPEGGAAGTGSASAYSSQEWEKVSTTSAAGAVPAPSAAEQAQAQAELSAAESVAAFVSGEEQTPGSPLASDVTATPAASAAAPPADIAAVPSAQEQSAAAAEAALAEAVAEQASHSA
ncbi:MAS20-domain-containing protein [Tilletiopsis washingtonensis]|uniref:MAS20-domain-containing protein n=1 Tax=Tilletiopsis washingtonensis TaxID=58919 RepID=A0A316Z890_9BASI|nr:MAS20-domain-containing protein [Tilletiopsis washingtonensis]PWN97819.1 MAS20-domain-containing protein [Tilletiopsis washingtonensis]